MKKIMALFVGFVLVVLIVGILHVAYQPVNDQITINGLTIATENVAGILVKDGEQYFEVQGTEEFSDLFEFDAWQELIDEPQGEPEIIIGFAEAWIIKIFPDGSVKAHNGYAPLGQKSSVYYTMPVQAIDDLKFYFHSYGTERILGDGISISTFHE